MSHDTHDSHGHPHESHNDKPSLQFNSAFYFVIIVAGLFIASIGFVKSMSHSEGGHDAHGAQHTEAAGHEAHGAATHEEHATEGHPTEAAPAEHH